MADIPMPVMPLMRGEDGKLRSDSLSRGGCLPFIPTAEFPTVQSLLDAFDKPDDLVAVTVPGAGKMIAIVRKDQLSKLHQREAVVEQVLAERGLTVDMIADQPMEKVLELRAEIQRRLKC